MPHSLERALCEGGYISLVLGPVLSLEKLSEKWGACPWAIWLSESSAEQSSGARKEVEIALAAWLLAVGNQSPGEAGKSVSGREDHESGHLIWRRVSSVLMVEQCKISIEEEIFIWGHLLLQCLFSVKLNNFWHSWGFPGTFLSYLPIRLTYCISVRTWYL